MRIEIPDGRSTEEIIQISYLVMQGGWIYHEYGGTWSKIGFTQKDYKDHDTAEFSTSEAYSAQVKIFTDLNPDYAPPL